MSNFLFVESMFHLSFVNSSYADDDKSSELPPVHLHGLNIFYPLVLHDRKGTVAIHYNQSLENFTEG